MPISSMPISVAKVLAGSLFPSLAVDDRYRDRIYPLAELSKYIMRESGYFHIQATKPDTISKLAERQTNVCQPIFNLACLVDVFACEIIATVF